MKIVAERTGNKLDNLAPHDAIVRDPESIVHIDWSKEWHWEIKKLCKHFLKVD